MPSKWAEKKERLAREQFERDLQRQSDDTSLSLDRVAGGAAMGDGDEQLFEKKLSKEEKKARAKAAREAKRKAKKKGDGGDDDDDDNNGNDDPEKKVAQALQAAKQATAGGDNGGSGDDTIDDGIDHEKADALAAAGTICTFARSRKFDARSRDINVSNFLLQHMGRVMLEETEIVLNHGNRYGLIGRNGCGKSTLLKALGARAVPVPKSIDIFFLDSEVEPSKEITALQAVMSVDEERTLLEQQAEELNHLLSELADNPDSFGGGDSDGNNNDKTFEEQQEEVMDTLNAIYERLDALDATTAEVRARSILKGLGFTHSMQGKPTADFSGGWRMRVSLARALFIQPMCLLLDEPTNHLEYVVRCWFWPGLESGELTLPFPLLLFFFFEFLLSCTS